MGLLLPLKKLPQCNKRRSLTEERLTTEDGLPSGASQPLALANIAYSVYLANMAVYKLQIRYPGIRWDTVLCLLWCFLQKPNQWQKEDEGISKDHYERTSPGKRNFWELWVVRVLRTGSYNVQVSSTVCALSITFKNLACAVSIDNFWTWTFWGNFVFLVTFFFFYVKGPFLNLRRANAIIAFKNVTTD